MLVCVNNNNIIPLPYIRCDGVLTDKNFNVVDALSPASVLHLESGLQAGLLQDWIPTPINCVRIGAEKCSEDIFFPVWSDTLIVRILEVRFRKAEQEHWTVARLFEGLDN